MSIFDNSPSGKTPKSKDPTLSKNEMFRLQIRKRQKEQRFKAVRKQLASSLRDITFLEQLQSDRDNFKLQKIQWVVNGLESGANNVQFYDQIKQMNLQSFFEELIMNNQIALCDKNKIIKCLNELTYFINKFPQQFIESSVFLDYLRETIKKMNIQNEEESLFIYRSIALVENLTSFLVDEFNLFMAQSDFLVQIQNIVDRQYFTDQGKQNSNELRVQILKTYKNLYMNIHQDADLKFVSKKLDQILNDSRNFKNQKGIQTILVCLRMSLNCQQYWQMVTDDENLTLFILIKIQEIAKIIRSQFMIECFKQLMFFVIALSKITQGNMSLYVQQIIYALPQKLIFSFLVDLSNNPTGENKRIVCIALKAIQSIQMPFSEFVYSNFGEKQDFIQIVIQQHIITNVTYGKFAVRILGRILQEQPASIDMMVNNGLMDGLADMTSEQFLQHQKIDVIDFIQKLVMAEQVLRQKGKDTSNKIIGNLHVRGIMKDIEHMQDSPNRDLYRRAENFLQNIRKMENAN